MDKLEILVCSTIEILHDLSWDRREPDRFYEWKYICLRDFVIFNI